MNDECYLCDGCLDAFLTTPILEFPNGEISQICEECADKHTPGWREDKEDD